MNPAQQRIVSLPTGLGKTQYVTVSIALKTTAEAAAGGKGELLRSAFCWLMHR
jgi:hypothetical protein